MRQASTEGETALLLDEAAQVLDRGGLVILPTETVYGVAAHPAAAGAARRLAEAKGREGEKPIAFLAADAADVRRYGAVWGRTAERLAKRFWPGPLTMVLDVEGREGSATEGFRVPDFDIARRLLRRCGGLLRVTSANRSGEPAALTAEEAVGALGGAVGLAIDAGRVPGGTASTVVRVAGEIMTILREGALSEEELKREQ
jgi:tRNA threonylcarbamoyl adenosine modification protein (Sua5/YciO/YrdC/YwlC family)